MRSSLVDIIARILSTCCTKTHKTIKSLSD